MNLHQIKIIIIDKIQNKSDTEIKLDVLQDELSKELHNVNRDTIKEAFDNLIEEGKLIVDKTTGIIDSHI